MERSLAKPVDTTEKPVPPIRAYTFQQLAKLYDVPERTLRRWLVLLKAEIGPRIGHFYTPRQVKIIFERLGAPFVWLFTLLFGGLLGDSGDSGDDGDQESKMKATLK